MLYKNVPADLTGKGNDDRLSLHRNIQSNVHFRAGFYKLECAVRKKMEKGGTIVSNELYQKTGIAVNCLAQDLLTRKKGDRIPSISEYQEKLGVSRGTIQNGLNYLKERRAVTLMSRGHMGTFIEFLDYRRLQECSFNKEILGSMPLPYSLCYQGLATALFQLMSPYAFNLVYARGSGSRMKLLTSGMCQFSVCSLYAAEEAVRADDGIEIAMDLGPGTYLTQHMLVFRDAGKKAIESGMRVAYDRDSMDHRHLTELMVGEVPNVSLIQMKAHQTVKAIQSGQVDAGIWNLDGILEAGYTDLNMVPIPITSETAKYSSAAFVVCKENQEIAQLLRQAIRPETVRQIQQAVRDGRMDSDY